MQYNKQADQCIETYCTDTHELSDEENTADETQNEAMQMETPQETTQPNYGRDYPPLTGHPSAKQQRRVNPRGGGTHRGSYRGTKRPDNSAYKRRRSSSPDYSAHQYQRRRYQIDNYSSGSRNDYRRESYSYRPSQYREYFGHDNSY